MAQSWWCNEDWRKKGEKGGLLRVDTGPFTSHCLSHIIFWWRSYLFRFWLFRFLLVSFSLFDSPFFFFSVTCAGGITAAATTNVSAIVKRQEDKEEERNMEEKTRANEEGKRRNGRVFRKDELQWHDCWLWKASTDAAMAWPYFIAHAPWRWQ